MAERGLFLTAAEYHFNPCLFQRSKKWFGSLFTDAPQGLFPCKLSTEVISCGRSSFDLLSKITDLKDGEVLCWLAFKSTMVSMKNRKSDPIPDHIRYPLQSLARMNNPVVLKKYQPMSRPFKVFSYSCVMHPSDTDYNQHTNNRTYVQICLDAVSVAHMESDIFSYLMDPADFDIKSMKMWYVGESLLGDHLVCHTWPDESNGMIAHFQVDLKSKTIFHNSIEFYPPTGNSKL